MIPNISQNSTYKAGVAKSVKGDGVTIKVTETATAYHVSTIRQVSTGKGGSSSSTSTTLCYLCKVTGGDSTSYTVDIYANGKDSASTGSGTLQVANMHINESLSIGVWVIGHPSIVTEIAGD